MDLISAIRAQLQDTRTRRDSKASAKDFAPLTIDRLRPKLLVHTVLAGVAEWQTRWTQNPTFIQSQIVGIFVVTTTAPTYDLALLVSGGRESGHLVVASPRLFRAAPHHRGFVMIIVVLNTANLIPPWFPGTHSGIESVEMLAMAHL